MTSGRYGKRAAAEGEPTDAKSRRRTPTALCNRRGNPEGAWLDAPYRKLASAVAAAYGWAADLPDADLLAHLLAFNAVRVVTDVT